MPLVLINGEKRDGRAIKKNGVCTTLGVVYLHLLQDILRASPFFEYPEMGKKKKRKRKLGYIDEKRKKGEII